MWHYSASFAFFLENDALYRYGIQIKFYASQARILAIPCKCSLDEYPVLIMDIFYYWILVQIFCVSVYCHFPPQLQSFYDFGLCVFLSSAACLSFSRQLFAFRFSFRILTFIFMIFLPRQWRYNILFHCRMFPTANGAC